MALTKIPGSLIDTASGINGLIYPSSDGTAGQFLTTDGSGNLSFATVTTYTDSDVETYLDGGTSTPTFATATVSGTLTVVGDLDLTGNINSYNVTDLDITDQTITLGAGQTEALSGGSGIIVDGSNASILWDETNDEWDFNKNINVTGAVVSSANGAITTANGTTARFAVSETGGATTAMDARGSTGNIGTRSNHTLGFLVNDVQKATLTAGGDFTVTNDIKVTTTNPRIDYDGGNSGALRFYSTSAAQERMRITSEGNVGIGEITPLGQLHIKVNDVGATASAQGNQLILEGTENGLSILSSTAAAGYINFGDSDDNDVGVIIYDHSSNSMRFRVNASERMRIDSDGKIRIGNNIPMWSGQYGGALILKGNNATSDRHARLTVVDSTGTAAYTGLIVSNTGRVGIGTTNPSGEFHVDSGLAPCDIHFTTGSTGGTGYDVNLNMTGGANNSEMNLNMGIAGDADREQIKTYQSAMKFRTANAERMEILSTGQVRFQGDQTEGNGGYLSSWDDNSGIVSGGGYQTQSGWWWTSNRTSACVNDSGQIMFYANYTGGTAGQVNSVTIRAKINDSSNSGDFYTNDGSVSSLSDSRLKTNIENLTDGLDILTQLRPVTFEYNDNSVDERGREQLGKADGVTRYGFIAQEVESVAPQYVNTETGMIGGEEVDDLKSMSQTRLIPMLVKSIQELKTELDAAKARITELEG